MTYILTIQLGSAAHHFGSSASFLLTLMLLFLLFDNTFVFVSRLEVFLCYPSHSHFVMLSATSLFLSLKVAMLCVCVCECLCAIQLGWRRGLGVVLFLGKISKSFSHSNVFVVNEKQLLYHSLRNSQGGSICWTQIVVVSKAKPKVNDQQVVKCVMVHFEFIRKN